MVTLRNGRQVGWMVIGCGAGIASSGQVTRDRRLACAGSLGGCRAGVGVGWGLGWCEELAHDFGACGDDGSEFAAVDDFGGAGGGVSDEAGGFLAADAVGGDL